MVLLILHAFARQPNGRISTCKEQEGGNFEQIEGITSNRNKLQQNVTVVCVSVCRIVFDCMFVSLYLALPSSHFQSECVCMLFCFCL